MDKTWPIVIIVIYFAIMAAVAVVARKKAKTLDGFFLGGRGMGGWFSAFSYGTTYFSAVIFIGYAGKFGWGMGLSSVWIGVGNAIIGSLLAWKLLAGRTRFMSRYMGTTTMPQFFAERYRSKYIKLIAAVIVFVFLLPYSASVYQGIGYLFELVFGIPYYWCIIIMAAVTAIYLFFGGYFATSLSDFIQGIIMVVGVVVCVLLLLAAPEVNWGEGLSKLNENAFGGSTSLIPADWTGLSSPGFTVSVMVLLTSFGIWAMPQSVHKYHAVRDKKAIRQAMIISAVLCGIIGVGAYFMGSLGHLFFTAETVPATDQIMPEIMVSNMHPAMVGLVLVLLFAASMSTLASLSLSGSSALTMDAVKGFIKKDMPEKRLNILTKSACVVFIALSVLIAVFRVEAIVTLMSLSWGTLAGCFLGPFVWGLYGKRTNKAGAYASVISGLVLNITLVSVFGLSYSPQIGVLAMAVSVVITPLASLLYSRKPDPKAVELIEAYKNDPN